MTEGRDEGGKPNGSNTPGDLSWSDWEERTQQREAPSSELLDAMKHPDVPQVVLQAIARRSSSPPAGEEQPSDPEEITNRYLLGPGAPTAARIAQAKTAGQKAPSFARDTEQPLTMAFVMGFAMIAVVLGWLSFELLPR